MDVKGRREYIHTGTEGKERRRAGRRMGRGHVHIVGEGRHKRYGREGEGDTDMEVEKRVRDMQIYMCRAGKEGDT